MSDNPKEVEKEMEKAIFISADCWLKVFDLLPRSQLGFGIAMVSRRFDCFVDEHFKTRKWKLGKMQIRRKIGDNGANEMEIVNANLKSLPIPQVPLPNKVMAFGHIWTTFIDQNVLTFLGRFHRFSAKCAMNLFISTANVRILEMVVLNIMPMFKDTIREMYLNPIAFRQMRQFAPSMLIDCPALRVVDFGGTFLPEFPPDDSANASDGQAVTKWLFTPHLANLTKWFNIVELAVDQWLAIVEQIKAAFSSASSSVNFTISLAFPPSSSLSVVVPFELINEFTQEKLTLSKEVEEEFEEEAEHDVKCFCLVRSPIVPDDQKRQKINQMGGQWNKIDIHITDDGVDKSLLDDASAWLSGDH